MRFLFLIPLALGFAVWLAVMLAGSNLRIRSCQALRNVCHDAADDVTPYVLIAFFAVCIIAFVLLAAAPAHARIINTRAACEADARRLCSSDDLMAAGNGILGPIIACMTGEYHKGTLSAPCVSAVRQEMAKRHQIKRAKMVKRLRRAK
jgi:hypothetical protein